MTWVSQRDCYHRILHYRHPADPLRMLVLILDKRYDLTELGKCLAAVEFEGPGTVVIDTQKWRCKAWKIKGRAREVATDGIEAPR